MASASSLHPDNKGKGGGDELHRSGSFKRKKDAGKNVASASHENNDGPRSRWAMARAKMDVSKALAIMGFSSSRTLDRDAREELNSALSKQMEMIENPRYKERRRRQISQAGTASSLHAPTTVEEQQRNDVRLLHEAYQFLSRKFITQEPLHSPVATAPATTKKQQKGEDGEWHLP